MMLWSFLILVFLFSQLVRGKTMYIERVDDRRHDGAPAQVECRSLGADMLEKEYASSDFNNFPDQIPVFDFYADGVTCNGFQGTLKLWCINPNIMYLHTS